MSGQNFNTYFPKLLFKFAQIYYFSVYSLGVVRNGQILPIYYIMAHKIVLKKVTEIAVGNSDLE